MSDGLRDNPASGWESQRETIVDLRARLEEAEQYILTRESSEGQLAERLERLEAAYADLRARLEAAERENEALITVGDGLRDVVNTYLIDYDVDKPLEKAAHKVLAAWEKAKEGK